MPRLVGVLAVVALLLGFAAALLVVIYKVRVALVIIESIRAIIMTALALV